MSHWMQHLNKIRKQNPRLSLGEAMKLAKKSYHKGTRKHSRGHRGGGEALSGFGAPTPEYPGGGTLADGQVGASDVAKLASNTYAPLGSMSGGADLSPADFNSAAGAPAPTAAGKETMLQKAGRKSRRATRKSRKSRKGSRRH